MVERRTITVHAFGDGQVHLAVAYRGRLQQGRLNTLCGKLAVTQLSPFAAAAAAAGDRCKVCFSKVDDDGMLKASLVPASPRKAKPRPEAEVIDLATARGAKAEPVAPEAAAEKKPAVGRTSRGASKPAKPAAKKKPAARAKPAPGRLSRPGKAPKRS